MSARKINTNVMRSVLNRTKSQAGRRYLPGVHEGFPSLQIKSLVHAINGTGRSSSFWSEIEALSHEIDIAQKHNLLISENDALPEALHLSRDKYRKVVKVCQEVAQDNLRAIGSFQLLDFRKVIKQQSLLEEASGAVSEYINSQRRSSNPIDAPETQGNSQEHQIVDSLDRQNKQLQDALSEFIRFVTSKAATLSNNPLALLTGSAGSGKTHFLCDIAEQRLSDGKPTLILLARSISIKNNDLWASIAGAIPGKYSGSSLRSHLRSAAKRSKERALIFIDAINEADRRAWKRFIKNSLDQITAVPEIGIVLSCRSPFHNVMLTKRSRNKMVELWHPGFSGIEYKAQETIFGAYQLPLPEVPLLADEFSNPLFLISFCETVQSTTVHQQHRKIGQLSSGQMGMTKILEDFFKVKQAQISRDLLQDLGTNVFSINKWLWGRGRNEGVIKDTARIMAKCKERYALLEELDGIIASYVTDRCHINEVRERLLIEGVFVETIVWQGNHYQDAIFINYQKFSDHLIVRSLLTDIDYRNPEELRNIYKQFLDEPGLLEALMMEVPRWTKKELLLMVPVTEVSLASMRVFISGLYWRSVDAFVKDTDQMVNWILKQPQLSDELHEALVSLATKTRHPYRADVLCRYLIQQSLVNRDLVWSEFLRRCDRTSAPIKLLNWLFSSDVSKLPRDVAVNYMRILMWLLTTTRRRFRDKVTRVLVLIGSAFPEEICELTINSLEINDPYVSERMLAATYGIWLRKLPTLTIRSVEAKILFDTALIMYKAIFLPKSPHGTTHALSRDYARRIVLCALQKYSSLLSCRQIKRITPPFEYGGIRKWGRSIDKDEGRYRDGNGPMQMDFSNYTLGRLVRNRQNYDFDHRDYTTVKKNIFWRIYQLGYKLNRFAMIDTEIASMQYWSEQQGAGKVDRYGKKYCWIAYFELYGYRQDVRLLEELELQSDVGRPSDCGVDPSFPDTPNSVSIDDKDYLGNRSNPSARWITHSRVPKVGKLLVRKIINDLSGPWILLDGCVRQEDIRTKRDFSMWIHTRLISPPEISRLLILPFDRVDGAREFATTPHTTYTFAGEIPWADTWPQYEEDSIDFEDGWAFCYEEHDCLILNIGGKQLSERESSNILDSYLREATTDDSAMEVLTRLQSEGFKVDTLTTRRKVKYPRRTSIAVENPVSGFLWESYHSDVNGSKNLTLPSRKLCDALNLRMTVPNWDFIDRKGRKAVIVVKSGAEYGPGQEFSYIRQDLFERYLSATNKRLIWSISGERRTLYKDDDGEFQEPEPGDNIHQTFYRLFHYDDNVSKRLSRKR